MIPSNSVIKNPDHSSNNRDFTLEPNNSSQTTNEQTNRDKKQLAKIKSSYSQTQKDKYSQDSVRTYLQTIGRIPMLSGEEEVKLSRQIVELIELEQINQSLAEKLGREPKDEEWAEEAKLTLPQLRRRLYLSRQAKNKMIQANLRLVVFIAKKYLKRGLSLQDLIQEGNLGLIRAVEKFEPEKGCKFSTYAYWWIRQSITRAITDKSRTIRLPIHIYNKLALIKKAFKLLSEKLQRHPKEREMAEYLNMSVEQLRFLLKVVQVPFSMEVPIDREDSSRLLGESIESDLPTPEDWIAQESMREEVENILSCLSPQERDIISLRYGLGDRESKTSAEVSQLLNLSRKEIHQIRGRALNKLRRIYYSSYIEEYL